MTLDRTLSATPEQSAVRLKRVARALIEHHQEVLRARAEAAGGSGATRQGTGDGLAGKSPAAIVEALAGHAEAIGARDEVRDLLQSISVVRQKREAAARKEPAAPGRFSHEPTAERGRAAPNGISEEVVTGTIRHRVNDYVGRIRSSLSAEEVAVLDWVVDLAEAHVMVNVTINYDGSSGGGAPGRKLGGLGNVSQAVRDKHSTFQMIERSMHPGFTKTLRDMVLQLRLDDRPMSAADFAAALFPTHKDKSFRSGVTMTAVKYLAWRLLEIQYRERALTRPTSPERRVRGIITEPVK